MNINQNPMLNSKKTTEALHILRMVDSWIECLFVKAYFLFVLKKSKLHERIYLPKKNRKLQFEFRNLAFFI